MPWQCSSCGFDGNDDGTLRCSCGHENIVYEPPNYSKIDGALMFVAAGLVITVIMILSSFTDAIAFTKGVEKAVRLALGALFLIIPVALLILLFKKKRTFPRYIKLWYMANLVLAFINFISIKFAPDTTEKIKMLNSAIDVLALTTLTCCIWITYFFVSVRVKKTFIR